MQDTQSWILGFSASFVSICLFCGCDGGSPADAAMDGDADIDRDVEVDGPTDVRADVHADADSDEGGDEHPLGRVFELTPDDGPAVDLPLTGLPPDATTLTGTTFNVHSCMAVECDENAEQLALADENGDFLYNPVLDDIPDPAAEVSAYYHLERFLTRFEALGFSGFDWEIPIIVGFGFDEDNDGVPDDFFGGTLEVWGVPGMIMGRVGNRNLAYDPDVFGHELTHLVSAAVNPQDMTLGAHGLNVGPGAVAEGSADYFSCSFMDDAEMGAYAAGAFDLPYLSTLQNDAQCPGDRVGQAHVDGQIWSGALWELREQLGAELIDQALYDVLAELQLGHTLIDVATALRGRLQGNVPPTDLADFDEVIDARGLHSCESALELPLGSKRVLWVPSQFTEVWSDETGDTLFLDACPTALQLVINVVDGSGDLRINLFLPDDSEIDLSDLEVLVGLGAPVTYDEVGGVIEATSDLRTPAESPVVIGPTSSPPLAPGRVYISLLHHGDGDGIIEVSVDQI